MFYNQLILKGYQLISGMAGLCAWPFYYRHLKARGGGESLWFRLGLKAPPAPPPGSPRLWIHGVSVGEIASTPPLIAELRRRWPQAAFIISTGTETGQAVARRLFQDDRMLVCYFPLDLPWAVSRALQTLKPQVFITLESELWPNFLAAAKARGVRLALLNARLSDRSFRRWARWPKAAAALFGLFEVIAAGAPEDFHRLEKLGVPRKKLHLTGNLKVDRLLKAWRQEQEGQRPLPSPLPSSGADSTAVSAVGSSGAAQAPKRALETCLRLGKAPIFLAASTHAGEEEVVLAAYQRLAARHPDLVLLLAPRHPERTPEIERLVAGRGIAWERFSLLKAAQARRKAQVVLIDTIGDLFTLYGVADVAFVGGSLIPHGGQNILEPAVWGVPPLTGPHLNNFRWAKEILESCGALTMVEDPASLAEAVHHQLEHPRERRQWGQRVQESLVSHQGAAARQARLVAELWQG